MIWAIFSPIFSSFSTIFWKKSLDENKMSVYTFALLEYMGYIAPILYLVIFGYFTFLNINIFISIYILSICITWLAVAKITQFIYKNEKLSILAPYENLHKIFIIVAGFFIFSNVSKMTLLIAFLIVGGLILASLDFKKLQFPRFLKSFLVYQLLLAYAVIATGYVLQSISPIDYFIVESGIMISLYVLIIIYMKQFKEYKQGSKQFYYYRSISSVFSALSYSIGLFVIADLGIIMSIIIGFLYLGATLIFSALFLRDIPSKKDIIVSCFVSVLVGIALYFN